MLVSLFNGMPYGPTRERPTSGRCQGSCSSRSKPSQKEIRRTYLMYIYGAAHALSVSAGEQFVELVTDFIERGPGFVVNQPVEPRP